jgi:hypothetical protein
MISGRDYVLCDDFDGYHDEIAVASVDFIGRWLSCGHYYLQGEECFWMPTTKTTTLGHRSHSRWSRRENQGSKVMNMHPMLLPTMQLLIFFHSDVF